MRPTKKEINNYLGMLRNAKPSSLAIARKLHEQGETEPAIYRYLTIQNKMDHLEAIEVIRELTLTPDIG